MSDCNLDASCLGGVQAPHQHQHKRRPGREGQQRFASSNCPSCRSRDTETNHRVLHGERNETDRIEPTVEAVGHHRARLHGRAAAIAAVAGLLHAVPAILLLPVAVLLLRTPARAAACGAALSVLGFASGSASVSSARHAS